MEQYKSQKLKAYSFRINSFQILRENDAAAKQNKMRGCHLFPLCAAGMNPNTQTRLDRDRDSGCRRKNSLKGVG